MVLMHHGWLHPKFTVSDISEPSTDPAGVAIFEGGTLRLYGLYGFGGEAYPDHDCLHGYVILVGVPGTGCGMAVVRGFCMAMTIMV